MYSATERVVVLQSLFVVVTSTRTIIFFFFNDTATTEIYTLSLHDALPISGVDAWMPKLASGLTGLAGEPARELRSEEHTSELQSQSNLVCRLLLEKKKKTKNNSRVTKSSHCYDYCTDSN